MPLDLGQVLDSVVMQRGLKELNGDMHFDMGAAINQWHPMIEDRQGVYYHGQHVCSMDRGMVSEYKLWNVKDKISPVGWDEADNDNVSIRYEFVSKLQEGYEDLYEAAKRGADPSYMIRGDGILVHLTPLKIGKIRHRVIRVGWRHTFEGLLRRGIPGITRQSLAEKFGVNMLKYPVGAPDEVLSELVAE